ncbi:MAG: hypothetical protein GY822_01085 [Deltaproteobacteria bacterium]|nr:hypothetical protein [Deltaproteobacteria bacterium]
MTEQTKTPRFDTWVAAKDSRGCCEVYRNGRRHGWHCRTYPCGKIACEGTFVEGTEEGQWVFFDVRGDRVHSIEFQKGKPIQLFPNSQVAA